MRIKTLSLFLAVAGSSAIVGFARGDGYLTSVGSGDSKIPVVVVRGNAV